MPTNLIRNHYVITSVYNVNNGVAQCYTRRQANAFNWVIKEVLISWTPASVQTFVKIQNPLRDFPAFFLCNPLFWRLAEFWCIYSKLGWAYRRKIAGLYIGEPRAKLFFAHHFRVLSIGMSRKVRILWISHILYSKSW